MPPTLKSAAVPQSVFRFVDAARGVSCLSEAERFLTGGGQSTEVMFPTSRLRRGGAYTFFCSFPGHWNMMKGTLVFG